MSRAAHVEHTPQYFEGVDLKIQKKAERLLNKWGITPIEAVTALYEEIIHEHTWPLHLKIPNEETRKVFEETDKGIGLSKKYDNVNDLFKDLGI